MTTGSIAKSERVALCDLLDTKGPLAPTLCEGWTTSDLAAHLYIREHRPWMSVGIVMPGLSSVTQKAMDGAKGRIGYRGLVDRIRAGPGPLYKPLDRWVNTVEYFVHYEDVRRAGEEPAGPRQDAALDAALWPSVRRGARFFARRLTDAGVEAVAPGFGSVRASSAVPLVTITGTPQELLLYLFGRKEVARVELDGPAAAVAAVQEAPFGF